MPSSSDIEVLCRIYIKILHCKMIVSKAQLTTEGPCSHASSVDRVAKILLGVSKKKKAEFGGNALGDVNSSPPPFKCHHIIINLVRRFSGIDPGINPL